MSVEGTIHSMLSGGKITTPYYIVVTDGAGKTATGYLAGVGAGETLGSEIASGTLTLNQLYKIITTVSNFSPWIDLGQQSDLYVVLCATYLENGIVLFGGLNGNDSARLFRSIDYGVNWASIDITAVNENRVWGLGYLENGIVLAGTGLDGKVLRSTDYGVTWTDLGQISPTMIHIECFKYLGNGIVLAGGGNNGEILRSTDYGATWISLGRQFLEEFIWGFANLGGGVIVAGTDSHGKILRSTDYGATWTDLGQQYGQDYISCIISLGDGISVAGTRTGGKILRSTNYGATWSDLGQQAGLFEITGLYYVGNGIIIGTGYTAGGLEGHIIRSIDYGLTWSDLGQQFSEGRAYSPLYLEDGIAIVGTGLNGKILRSVKQTIKDYFISDGTETCDTNNKVKRVTDPPSTGVHVVSALNGTTRAWESVESGFDPNDVASWKIYKVGLPGFYLPGTGTFNRGDFTNGNAFFWTSVDLSPYAGTIITGATGLSALVGSRIYPLVLPQGAILPAVTYSVVSDVPEHAMGQDADIRTIRLQVSSWADTYLGAKAVDAQVNLALSRVKVGVKDIFSDNVMDEYEPNTDVYQVIHDFTVFYS